MGAAVAACLTLDAIEPTGLSALDAFFAPESGAPFAATSLSVGIPAPDDDAMERPLSLDAYLIRHPEATFFLRVQGDQFQDQGIQDGDLLVVDRAAAPSTDSVVVAVIEGQFRLARVGRDAQGRRVLHTAAGAPLDFDQGFDRTLYGVVRWSIHRLWPRRLSS